MSAGIAALLLAAWPAAGIAGAAPPGVHASLSGLAGDGGWYRSAVTLHWDVGTDGLVQTSGCEPAILISGDTPGVTKTCEARYNGGLTMTGQAVVKIDQTPPAAVRAVPATPANANGWWSKPVTVGWTGTDPTSGIASCTSATYSGPDAAGAPLTGTCRDAAGNVSSPAPISLNYDATPPTVTGAAAARAPDHRGWYLRPVAFAFRGADATSGLEGCDTVAYSGADGAAMTVGGACRDRAGNAATGSVPLRYDGAPPVLAAVRAVPGHGVIRLHWRASRDTTRVVVTRSPGLRGARSSVVYRGTRRTFADRRVVRDVRYAYRVTAIDEHAQTARARVATTSSLLAAPRRGARVKAPVVLRWRAVGGARYYNVQLFRGRRLVRTAWPSHARLRVSRLHAGRYRWYVWPGYGSSRAERRYGRLVGHSSFTIG